MMLKYVVPKLGSSVRDDLKINPRKQDMAPLTRVLAWTDFLRPSMVSSLLESGFVPKWLDVLHLWLTQPTASFEEIAQWYAFWKGTFPESVQALPGLAAGFTRGLQLMNKAIELGPDAPTKLPRPDHTRASMPTAVSVEMQKAGRKPAATAPRTQEITFRALVEEHAGRHNLLFVPTGKAHGRSRMALFKVSSRADGRGGLPVYVQDDAVWAQDGEEWRAISLDDMIVRATRSAS